jgi:hypothetical protein
MSSPCLAVPNHRSLRFCMLRPLHDLGACDHPVFFTALLTVQVSHTLGTTPLETLSHYLLPAYPAAAG